MDGAGLPRARAAEDAAGRGPARSAGHRGADRRGGARVFVANGRADGLLDDSFSASAALAADDRFAIADVTGRKGYISLGYRKPGLSIEAGVHAALLTLYDDGVVRRLVKRWHLEDATLLPLALTRLSQVSEVAERRELWGAETKKAVANFPVSGEPIPVPVARWLGRIKAAAARANADLGLLDADKAERIAAAADRVANGELDDQFPIDVFQTGSGTSSNMNANEVIAALAGEDVHANDDVNMGQSSNDVFPSAVHLAALGEITSDLLPALDRLASAFETKAAEFEDVVKSGRTHLMDAVPVTLGQEFAGYAAQVRQGIARVESTLERLGQIPLGGTAVGTGLNTHPEFAERVRRRLAEETGLRVLPPADPFEAQAARDGIVEASAMLKVVAVSLTKIANDIRWLGSGPRAGSREIFLPELQKGSSIMPGKVNPVIPEVVTQVAAQVIGNDQAIAVGGMQGHFELNVFVPLIARNILDSIKPLSAAARLFAEKCVDGIEANREQCERYAELHPLRGDRAQPAHRLRQGDRDRPGGGRLRTPSARSRATPACPTDVLDEALDYRAMARPHE